MGLLQKAVETYDCNRKYIGEYREGHTVLSPISHIVTRADLEIIIDAEGNFCAASAVDKSAPKIIIPVTEESVARGNKPCAHPLCDQLSYLAPYNSEKHALYLEQLTKWATSEYSHPKLQPILNYILKGTILSDLEQCDLIQLNGKGIPQNEKLMVRWRVLGTGDKDACWQDTTLIDSFIGFYKTIHQDDEQGLCMISGEITQKSQKYPGRIIPTSANAKLISANDDKGFTYLGRFTQESQAVEIGYEASQKAHNALRWLAAEQGSQVVFGGRTFLCWNPQGRKVCHVTGAFRKVKKEVTEPTEYQRELQQTLKGYRSELPEKEGVVIAAFDAATKGRLALTYYNELLSSDFLQRLYEWDCYCCWPTRGFGIQSPGLWKIVNSAFGTPQGDKNSMMLKTDDRVMRQQMQRLISCRIDGAAMPVDIVRGLCERTSRLQIYPKNLRENLLTTACAVIRKYRYDTFKEEWEMTLEANKTDRSYQFGRLLAVLEKVERDTYDKDEGRETNAIRQQSVFCQRPLYAAGNIQKQLERAYFPRLKPASRYFYKNLIGQIMEQINEFPQEQWNRPLTETYLMGYYLQRNALYTKHSNDMEEQEDE